jgi:hypothetical protein
MKSPLRFSKALILFLPFSFFWLSAQLPDSIFANGTFYKFALFKYELYRGDRGIASSEQLRLYPDSTYMYSLWGISQREITDSGRYEVKKYSLKFNSVVPYLIITDSTGRVENEEFFFFKNRKAKLKERLLRFRPRYYWIRRKLCKQQTVLRLSKME